MDSKVKTAIVNATGHGLTLKVGRRNCYARLSSIKAGGEYTMQLDVNWTYQEFVAQDKTRQANQVFITSDDCCDYERFTITEVDGKLDVQRVLRQQFRTSTPNATELETSSPIRRRSWRSWLYKFTHV